MSAKEVQRGMARELHAQVAKSRRRVEATQGTMLAASDLMKLYADENGATFDSVVARVKHAAQKSIAQGNRNGHLVDDWTDPVSIGEVMAAAATNYPGSDYARDVVSSAVKVPAFKIRLDAGELTWEGESHGVPRKTSLNPSKSRHPGTKSIVEVREILASRDPETKCHPTCQGWDVFETNRETEHEGFEIEVCDECNSAQPKQLKLMDEDVEQLPEAQLALAKTLERLEAEEHEEVEAAVREIHGGKVVPRGNPSGKFYVFRYIDGSGWRTKPKEYFGPFDSKADADGAVRDEIAKYGEGSSRYVVKQLTDQQFKELWFGHGQRRGLPPGVAMNPRRRNSVEDDLGINPRRNPTCAPCMSYDRWSHELGREAAKTGATVVYGGHTHDAWKAGKTPDEYARELAAMGRTKARTLR